MLNDQFNAISGDVLDMFDMLSRYPGGSFSSQTTISTIQTALNSGTYSAYIILGASYSTRIVPDFNYRITLDNVDANKDAAKQEIYYIMNQAGLTFSDL